MTAELVKLYPEETLADLMRIKMDMLTTLSRVMVAANQFGCALQKAGMIDSATKIYSVVPTFGEVHADIGKEIIALTKKAERPHQP